MQLVAILLTSVLSAGLQAQTLLRWKLAAGDSFTVEMQQQTESQVAFSGKSAATKIDLDLQLAWDVTAARESTITLKQTIRRIHLKLAAPQGAAVEYDSESNARPTGQARDLAEALRPLIGAELEIAMNARGEIDSAKPANEAAKAAFADGKAAESGDASRGAVQQLLRQSLIVLPEKDVAVGDRWTSTTELTTAAGPMKQETTYQFASIGDRDGKQLCQIETNSKLASISAASAPQAPSAKIALKSHEQTGTILFSAEEGRLIETEQTQKLVTERSYREVTIVVKLDSKQTTKITPSRRP
jgi:hypothetical protein